MAAHTQAAARCGQARARPSYLFAAQWRAPHACQSPPAICRPQPGTLQRRDAHSCPLTLGPASRSRLSCRAVRRPHSIHPLHTHACMAAARAPHIGRTALVLGTRGLQRTPALYQHPLVGCPRSSSSSLWVTAIPHWTRPAWRRQELAAACRAVLLSLQPRWSLGCLERRSLVSRSAARGCWPVSALGARAARSAVAACPASLAGAPQPSQAAGRALQAAPRLALSPLDWTCGQRSRSQPYRRRRQSSCAQHQRQQVWLRHQQRLCRRLLHHRLQTSTMHRDQQLAWSASVGSVARCPSTATAAVVCCSGCCPRSPRRTSARTWQCCSRRC